MITEHLMNTKMWNGLRKESVQIDSGSAATNRRQSIAAQYNSEPHTVECARKEGAEQPIII